MNRKDTNVSPYKTPAFLYSMGQAARSISLYVNADRTELIYFNHNGSTSSLNIKPLKLEDQWIYLSSNITSTESNVSIGKVLAAVDSLMTIWKSDLSDKIKWEFFQVMAVSVLL